MSYVRRNCSVSQRFRSILTAQRRSTNSVSVPIHDYIHSREGSSILNQSQKRRVYSGTSLLNVGRRVYPRVFSNSLSGVAGVDMDGAIDARRESIVERIHSTQTKIVLFVTGGGMHVRVTNNKCQLCVYILSRVQTVSDLIVLLFYSDV